MLLEGRRSWPSPAEFEARGASSLRRAAEYHGGAEHWAREFGVRPPARWRRWTEERIRAELAAFLRDRDAWPPPREFERAGKRPLLYAARRHGGAARWAREFGVEPPSGRQPNKWTEERIRAELETFLEGRDHWPTVREFREARLGGLWRVVHQGRGLDWWARAFGLPRERPRLEPLPPPANGPPPLDEAATRAELGRYLAGRSSFPPRRAFEADREGDLWLAARAHGGPARWAREFGLRLRGRPPAAALEA